jgi:hypothetical protein
MKRKYYPINSVFRFGVKQADFIEYLKPNYSDYSIYRTLGYIQSGLVSLTVREISEKECIYDVTDIELLNQILARVKNDARNIRLHKVYSAAIHRYIRYVSQNRAIG